MAIRVQRYFSEARNQDASGLRPLEDFFDRPALVILGDPGLGKTTSFKLAEQSEPNAVFCTLRAFLRTQNLDKFSGRTLYIDALDEVRATKADGSQVLDDLIGRLESLGHPRFRLSCRGSDWYGGLDERNLQEASANGQITVLQLEPLRRDDVEAIVRDHGIDPEEFLANATQRGVERLLTNPETLGLLLTAVGEGKGWPRTKTQLFEVACHRLAEELNDEHAHSRMGQVEVVPGIGTAG